MDPRYSFSTTSDAIRTSGNADIVTNTTDLHSTYKENNDYQESSNNNKSMRKSLLPTSSRRTTMVTRTVDHSQPPVENPNNTPEYNAKLRKEYERVQQCNHMVETMIQDFTNFADNMKTFNDRLDEANQLLDLWRQILSQTQHTKHLMEAVSLENTQSQQKPPTTAPVPAPPMNTKPTTTTTATITKSRRIPVPVGTHMTKKLKTSNERRRMV